MSPRKKDQPQDQPATWPELPLMELQSILDGHQNPDGAFTRPAGLPDRLLAPVDMVQPGRWQPRSVFVDSQINELAESIQAHGILNPLKVVVNSLGNFELVAGERRLLAARSISLAMVPVEILAGTDAQMAEIAIVDNVQRADLSPLEEGTAYQKLIDAGLSESEVARKMGKSRGYVQQRRALAGAAPEVAQALAEGVLSLGQLRGLLAGAGDDHDIQREALTSIKALIERGTPLNEQRTKEHTQGTATRRYVDMLSKWGWAMVFLTHQKVIWSLTDRPCVVDLVDLARMVAEQRRPAPGDPPAQAEISAEISADLSKRGWLVNKNSYYPWIAIRRGGDDLFITSDEIAEVHSQALEDIAELERRAKSLECQILWRSERGNGSTCLLNKQGLVCSPLHTFQTVAQALDLAERGELVWKEPEKCARCGESLFQNWQFAYPGKMHLHCYEDSRNTPTRPAQAAQAAQVAGYALDYELDIPTEFEPAPTDPEEADLQRMAWISMMSRPDALALAVVLIEQLQSDVVQTVDELAQMADSALQEVLALLMAEAVDLEAYHERTATG
jgi:ParB/RepB/Spo0J family partition protein